MALSPSGERVGRGGNPLVFLIIQRAGQGFVPLSPALSPEGEREI